MLADICWISTLSGNANMNGTFPLSIFAAPKLEQLYIVTTPFSYHSEKMTSGFFYFQGGIEYQFDWNDPYSFRQLCL